MGEEYYYSLRSILIWLTLAMIGMWLMSVGQKYELMRLRAAFSHFVTCPRCRRGESISPEAQARAEAEHG